MRIFSFIAILQTKTRRTETTARSSRTLPRSAFHLAVSSRSPRPRVDQFTRTLYCFGVVAAPVVVLAFALCFRWRGVAFIAAPFVVNEAICGSPGTVVSVRLSPTFLARIDIAGWAGGAVP